MRRLHHHITASRTKWRRIRAAGNCTRRCSSRPHLWRNQLPHTSKMAGVLQSSAAHPITLASVPLTLGAEVECEMYTLLARCVCASHFIPRALLPTVVFILYVFNHTVSITLPISAHSAYDFFFWLHRSLLRIFQLLHASIWNDIMLYDTVGFCRRFVAKHVASILCSCRFVDFFYDAIRLYEVSAVAERRAVGRCWLHA